MDTTIMKLFSAVIFCLTVNTIAQAHGDKDHPGEMPEYDAVTTDFGNYRADLVPSKIVHISMADTMRFSPSVLKLVRGDIVKFKITNTTLV